MCKFQYFRVFYSVFFCNNEYEYELPAHYVDTNPNRTVLGNEHDSPGASMQHYSIRNMPVAVADATKHLACVRFVRVAGSTSACIHLTCVLTRVYREFWHWVIRRLPPTTTTLDYLCMGHIEIELTFRLSGSLSSVPQMHTECHTLCRVRSSKRSPIER